MLHTMIRKARLDAGLSQQHLSDLAEIPRSQLQILEKGGNVTLDTLEKVLRAMSLSLAVVSPDDIQTMRKAMSDLDGVLTKLASQVTSRETGDLQRLLEMTRELETLVRNTASEAAAAPLAATAAEAEQKLAEALREDRRAARRRRR
jgi:transcriptional regulator with XRE-family HTH domain